METGIEYKNFPFNNTLVCLASGAFQDLPELFTSGIISSQPGFTERDRLIPACAISGSTDEKLK